jgi:hypothetical protein
MFGHRPLIFLEHVARPKEIVPENIAPQQNEERRSDPAGVQIHERASAQENDERCYYGRNLPGDPPARLNDNPEVRQADSKQYEHNQRRNPPVQFTCEVARNKPPIGDKAAEADTTNCKEERQNSLHVCKPQPNVMFNSLRHRYRVAEEDDEIASLHFALVETALVTTRGAMMMR